MDGGVKNINLKMEKYSFPYSIFQCNVISTVLRQVTRDREGNRYETVQSGTNFKKRIFIWNLFSIFTPSFDFNVTGRPWLET